MTTFLFCQKKKPSAAMIITPRTLPMIHGNGDFRGTITQHSDRRLKKNIAYINDGLAAIVALKPARYDRTDNGTVGQLGLIAQDVQAYIPEAVREVDGGKAVGKILGLDYSVITVRTIGAIQELNARIVALEAQVKALSKKDN